MLQAARQELKSNDIQTQTSFDTQLPCSYFPFLANSCWAMDFHRETAQPQQKPYILECRNWVNDSIDALIAFLLSVREKCLDKLAMCHGAEAEFVNDFAPHELIGWHTTNTRGISLTW